MRIKLKEEWKQQNGKYKCPYCDKEYSKYGICSHIWRSHLNPNHDPNIGYKTKGREPWNKNLTKDQDSRIDKQVKTYKQRCKNGEIIPGFKNKTHSKEFRKRLSKKLSLYNPGGRCSFYNYTNIKGKTFKVQGTWEYRFAKVLDLLDEDWIKIGIHNPEHSFNWINDNNEEKTYTPDFYSPKFNKYFEVKGHWWGNDKRKMELVLKQNNINIEIIKKKELEQYEQLIS